MSRAAVVCHFKLTASRNKHALSVPLKQQAKWQASQSCAAHAKSKGALNANKTALCGTPSQV